jgi:hypothetical protein
MTYTTQNSAKRTMTAVDTSRVFAEIDMLAVQRLMAECAAKFGDINPQNIREVMEWERPRGAELFAIVAAERGLTPAEIHGGYIDPK